MQGLAGCGKNGRLPRYPQLVLKRLAKQALPLETLLESIFEAGRAVLSARPVIVTDFLRRPKKESVSILPGLQRGFRPHAGDCCKGCQHGSYFKNDGA